MKTGETTTLDIKMSWKKKRSVVTRHSTGSFHCSICTAPEYSVRVHQTCVVYAKKKKKYKNYREKKQTKRFSQK